jgi:hypothetical protein
MQNPLPLFARFGRQFACFEPPRDRGLRSILASCKGNEEMNMRKISSAFAGGSRENWWSQHREASLNWLALGLLLAAWNAADNGAATQAKRRPESLRGYAYVSVRAQRSAATDR